MIEPGQFALFFAAALVLAVTPGSGISYVAARMLAGGRAEGVWRGGMRWCLGVRGLRWGRGRRSGRGRWWRR